jgi:hypothetical protein
MSIFNADGDRLDSKAFNSVIKKMAVLAIFYLTVIFQ